MTIGHRYAVFIGLKLKRGETNHTIHPELVHSDSIRKIFSQIFDVLHIQAIYRPLKRHPCTALYFGTKFRLISSTKNFGQKSPETISHGISRN